MLHGSVFGHEFLATLSRTQKGSNMYLNSSDDCGPADRLRLQVTLKFHWSLHKTHLLKMCLKIIKAILKKKSGKGPFWETEMHHPLVFLSG